MNRENNISTSVAFSTVSPIGSQPAIKEIPDSENIKVKIVLKKKIHHFEWNTHTEKDYDSNLKI